MSKTKNYSDNLVFAKMWEESLPYTKMRGLSTESISALKYRLRKFIIEANIQKWEDFDDVIRVYNFVDNLQSLERSDSYIRNMLKILKGFIDHFIGLNDYNETPYPYKRNPFNDVLLKRNWNIKVKSYPPREIDEVELWVSSIPRVDYMTAWGLACNALRRNELMNLEKDQFDIESREIRNVKRKGGMVQERLGIPEWLAPMLKIHLESLNTAKLFNVDYRTITHHFSKSHWNKLTKLMQNLEKKVVLNTEWQDTLKTLKKMQKWGRPVMHSMRSTWSTYAENSNMKMGFRYYHLSHTLPGMREVYSQIEQIDSVFNAYLEEINLEGIKYDFGRVY